MRKVLLDEENKNVFQDVGKNEPALLDISLVCAYDSETGEYASFLEEELPAFWKIVEKADILVGFNSDHFDIPLLGKYYAGDLTKIKSVDLMREIKNSLGRRVGLNAVAEATLGEKKSGHGLEAITWWKKGEIDKIRKYCMDDVRITKELYEYALKNGKLKYKDGNEIKDIILDTSKWEEKKTNGLTKSLF